MKIVALPALVALALVLSACVDTPAPAPTIAEETPSATPTPTPTPDPGPPAVADLVVSTEGLNTLKIGQPPTSDPVTDMVAFDDDICVYEEFGVEPGGPLAGGWAPLAIYGDGRPTAGIDGFALFAISVGDDGNVSRIDINDSTIPTDRGIHIGDPESAIMIAYPDAVVAQSTEVSTVYRVTGTAGVLDLEVEAGQDKVSWIRVNKAGSPVYGVAATDNVIFGCGYTP